MFTAEELERGEIWPKEITTKGAIRCGIYSSLMAVISVVIFSFYFNVSLKNLLSLHFFKESSIANSLSNKDILAVNHLRYERVDGKNSGALLNFIIKGSPSVIDNFELSSLIGIKIINKSALGAASFGRVSSNDFIVTFENEIDAIIIPSIYLGNLYLSKEDATKSEVDFFRPDFKKFYKFNDSKIVRITLKKGTSLYVPSNTWYQFSGDGKNEIYEFAGERVFNDLYAAVANLE